MGSFPSTAWPRIRTRPTASLGFVTPRSWHKGSTKPHPREHFTAQNNANSHLHRLPTELLLEIDQYLGPEPSASSWSDAAAKMALRATCRRFRFELPGPPGPSYCWSNADRRAYSNRLALAGFRRLCAEERAGRLDGDARAGEHGGERRVCCICRSSHVKSCFTPGEQMKEPEKRMCIGSQGVLEICPHYRVTHAGLCVRLRVRAIHIDCKDEHGPRSAWIPSPRTRTTVKVREVQERGKNETKVEIVLDLGEVADKTNDEIVLKALERADWRVCPHLRTCDAGAWRLLLNDTEGAAFLGFLRQYVSCKVVGATWCTHVCATPDCDTRVTLYTKPEKRRGYTIDFLYLKIERFLGELRNGADERKWLAQIVDASCLEDDRVSSVLAQNPSGMLVKMGKKSAPMT